MMNSEKTSLTPIKTILENLFNDKTLPFNMDDARIWAVWKETVGPAISENARPSWIKNGKLRVIVSDSVWLQELRFVEQEIRKRLNEKLERNAVKKIELRVGAI